MRTICSEAKQQLSSCVMHDCDDELPPTALGHGLGRGLNNNNFLGTSRPVAVAGATTSTYDSLQRPFKYDKQRGGWSSAADFYFACTSHAFGSVVFSELPVYALLFGGVYLLPAYLVAILLYAIPVFLIQTFLGQFSTSGTISAFRVAPLFKGIGYSILFLNLISLTYYGVVAAVPLVYAVYSLHTVIPWMSCDNAWNTPNCSVHNFYNEEDEFQYPHATVEFFRHIVHSNDKQFSFSLSWPVLYATTTIWLLTLLLILRRVSFIGKFFRCTCILLLSFFVVIFVYLLIHAKVSWDVLLGFFDTTEMSYSAIIGSVRAAIFMSTWLLGPGWGNVLTLGSYNKFRHDSEKLAYRVAATYVLLAFLAMICGRVALDHFEDEVGLLHYHVEEEHYMQFLYLCFAYLFGSFTSLPNFWCFLFFSMLFIAELSAVIIQILTVLTALFDEYEGIRSRKRLITILLTFVLMLTSIYFCTKQGFEHLHMLPTITLLTHVLISMVLLMMCTWIYGRERFQCDLQFMLGKTISNFKIFLLRFVTPAFLVVNILQILFFLHQDDPPSEMLILSQSIVFIVAVIYMAYRMCQTTGTFRNRLSQCFMPHDWHPVDADNRRFYEEIMGVSEMLVIDNSDHASA